MVKFVDLGALHASLQPELDGAWRRLIDGSGFIGGEAVEGFESRWASYCEAKFAIGVGNGTDALELALQGLGIGNGDEVILPTATYVATAESVANVGAQPVFADVNEETLGIDPTSVEAVVTPRTAAVIGVHLYGQPADLDALGQICSRHELALIEDAAQAHGARWRGMRIGSFGHVACFSFYPSKNLGAMGDAGAVVTSDENLARRIRQRANHGVGASGTHDVVGRNSRLDGIQAAVLDIKLDHLDAWNERRRVAAGAYKRGLGESVRSLRIDGRSDPVWHLFPIFPDDRESLAQSLSDRGVQTGVHYRQTCHEWEGFESVSLPIAERAFSRELSLPMHAFISDTDVAAVCEAVHEAIGGSAEG